MSQSDHGRCPECGGHLPPGLPMGLCPRCALAEDSFEGVSGPEREEDAPAVPREFGDYEELQEVGRGGMGIVFRAWQKSLERYVAIKMPIFGGFITPDLIKRFRGEAVFAASLRHPNIIPIHEVGIRNGQHYITMDYVDGQNLSARLRAHPLSIQEIALCLLKVARAVDYAHSQNVLHIDLKPSNILVDAEGEPYVTDFGLAQRIDGNSSITISGQVVGSPSYMAPEQASPRRGEVDRRSDVYGLGATLYYCLCGRPPFQAATLETTLHLVLTADPVAPRVLNPSVPLDLETICLKCLEKERNRRYQSAKELSEELERFTNNTPIHARPISRLEKVARWARRNPALAGAITVAAVFLFVGFVVSAWLAKRATTAASAARLNLYLADMSLAQRAIQRNNFSYARERLLAHLPEPGWPDLRGWEWRYLWKAVEAQNSESWGTGSVYSVAISASGIVAGDVGSRNGGIFVRDLVRHQTITNFSAGGGEQCKRACVFSLDGTLLAMARNDGVLLAHSGRWEWEKLESKQRGKVVSLAFYPDGGTLLATSTGGLKTWKLPAGEESKPPVAFTNDCRHLEISPDGRWLAISTLTKVVAWSLPGGEPVLSRSLGSAQVESIALSRRGWLAACDRDGRVLVWDLNVNPGRAGATNLLVRLDTRAHGPNYAAAFSSDGSLLAVAGSDQLIRVYNTSDWRERNAFRGHDSEIWGVAFAPNGAQLVSGGKDGLRVWNPQILPETGELPGTWFPLGFTLDSQLAVTLTPRRELQLWKVDTLALESTFKTPTNFPQPQYVIVTPDAKTVVYRSQTNVIHILDREREESRGKLKLDPKGLQDASPRQCSPDSRFVVVEVKRKRDDRVDRGAEVFDLKTLEPAFVVDHFKPLGFSPDGRFLGGKLPDTTAVVWDLQRHRRQEFVGAPEKINQIAFSRNGLIAASSEDHMIRVWDIASGSLRVTMRGHRAAVGQIVFSRDDRTLFSGGTDRTLKAWNVATGREVLSIDYENDTWELALSPDDTTLAIGGVQGQPRPVAVVRAPSLAEIDASRQRQNP